MTYTVELFRLSGGKCPFEQWFKTLRSQDTRHRIRQRLIRLEQGQLGDYKPLGDSVYELRLDMASGIRVYFGFSGKTVVLLLSGGDKSTQRRDIVKAKEYWHAYQEAQ